MIGDNKKGDHCQLPPTVKSSKAQDLGITMFERLHKLYGEKIAKMLTIQYRCFNLCSY
jgi:superfamily I DNA and/or RNA helicase